MNSSFMVARTQNRGATQRVTLTFHLSEVTP